jgi:hypothetical protein
MALQAVEELLDGLPLFRGLSKVLSEQKKKLSQAQSIEEINQHIKWIQDVLKNRGLLEKTWKSLRLLHEIVSRHKFLKRIAMELHEYKIKLLGIKKIDEIDSYYIQIRKTYSWMENIEENIEILNELTGRYPLFKGIKKKNYEHKKNILETQRFDSINSYDSYLNEIACLKEKIIYINNSIIWFDGFFKKQSFFQEKEMIIQLKRKSEQAVFYHEFNNIHSEIKEVRRVADAVVFLSEKWNNLLFLIKCSEGKKIMESDRGRIKKHIAWLLQDNKPLPVEHINRIAIKTETKFKAISNCEEKKFNIEELIENIKNFVETLDGFCSVLGLFFALISFVIV